MSKKIAVLLHGITRSNLDMIPLQMRLEKEGYDACINIKYPSTKHDLNKLTDMVYGRMAGNKNYQSADRVDFVTHSMGGLLARYVINKYRPAKLGSVIMLGTPNQGSEMADFLAQNKILAPAFHFIFGPAAHQLRTGVKHMKNETIHYPLGIIASDLSLNPIGNQVFGKANDTLVTIESTKLEGMRDHIVIPSTHAVMMFDPRVMDQVIYFLNHEKFDHSVVQRAKPTDLQDLQL